MGVYLRPFITYNWIEVSGQIRVLAALRRVKEAGWAPLAVCTPRRTVEVCCPRRKSNPDYSIVQPVT
jgi:hypothetical protein